MMRRLRERFHQLVDETSVGLTTTQRELLKTEVSSWFQAGTLPEIDRESGLSISLLGSFFVRFSIKDATDKARYKQCRAELRRSVTSAKNPFSKLFSDIPLTYLGDASAVELGASMKKLEKEEKIFGNGKRAQYKNIDLWVDDGYVRIDQVLNLRSNAKVVPFLRRFIHLQAGHNEKAQRVLLLLTWIQDVKDAKEQREVLSAQSTGRGLFFDSKLNIRFLMSSRGSYSTDSLNGLAHSLHGLYALYKMRFGTPSVDQPEIAQEVVLFHGFPTKEGAPTYAPSYVNWYLRRDGTTSEFHGVAVPGRKTIHAFGMDETFENRMRFLNINSEVDELTSSVESGDVHSRVRGGIMLSDSQEVRSEWSASSKFLLIRLSQIPINLMEPYPSFRARVREFAEHACKFIRPDEIDHPAKDLILEHVRNSPTGSTDGDSAESSNYFGESLVSNQLEINALARKTPADWRL